MKLHLNKHCRFKSFDRETVVLYAIKAHTMWSDPHVDLSLDP